MATPQLTIEVQNLKALRSFKWSPSGVSVLVGPNGAGKSTALRVVEFLRLTLEHGMLDAIRATYAGGELVSTGAAPQVARLMFARGNADWSLTVDRKPVADERAVGGGVTAFRAGSRFEFREPGAVSTHAANDSDVSVGVAMRAMPGSAIAQLGTYLLASRYFARPDLTLLRRELSPDTTDLALDTHSLGLFSVLKNWKTNSDFDDRIEFVIESMRELFPKLKTIDMPSLAQRVSARAVYADGVKLEPSDWADGFFVCLSLLTAIASVKRGVVAIDEPENSLHPELIRRMIELMREWSRTHETTVLLATHSPVVLNEFRDEPEKVFVMQPGRDHLPVRLDELKKREWLEHFALGDLYVQNEVGAPTQQ
jgi:predicted ATPase